LEIRKSATLTLIFTKPMADIVFKALISFGERIFFGPCEVVKLTPQERMSKNTISALFTKMYRLSRLN